MARIPIWLIWEVLSKIMSHPVKTIEKNVFQISGPTLEISQVVLKYNCTDNQSKDFDQINCWQGSLFTITLCILSLWDTPNVHFGQMSALAKCPLCQMSKTPVLFLSPVSFSLSLFLSLSLSFSLFLYLSIYLSIYLIFSLSEISV